jgi:cytochrome d ubiquinol oxidase subunit II
MDLNTLWFILLGVLLIGYAILDGFDLGVGILHTVARKDEERRIMLNAIGPLWDGNEVWLVTFGGALFAAFPMAYATAFSGFYTAFMLLLFALIFRALSIEFRSKLSAPLWRHFWDYAFSISSGAVALLFGVAVGNAMQGLPIDEEGNMRASFLSLLTPFPILVGILVIAMFVMHGSIYLYLKTEGKLQERIHGWMWRGFGFFLIMFMLTTMYALQALPTASHNLEEYPILWIIPVLTVLAIANIPRAIYKGKPLYAFVSSSCTIAALVFLFAEAMFPNLLVSSTDPAYNLTIYSAASSEKTLTIMAIIAVVGMPFVLAYTSVIYWTFRGKVELGKFSY